MKKTMKNVLLGFAIAVLAGAFGLAAKTMEAQTARAEAVSITPTKTAAATEFYMEEGASVRVKDGEAGIRFAATITESYWNTLQESYGETATYTFSSVLTANGVSQKKDFAAGDFTFEKGVKSFYTAVVYTDLTETELATLTTYEFSAQTYLTVVGESTADVIAACGETGSRSMEVVANAAWLDETGEHYQSTLLENYFTVGGDTEQVKGGFTADGNGVITAACVKDAQKVDVYYGTQKLTHTVSGDSVSFSGVSTDGLKVSNQVRISIFADGKVYRSNVTYAETLLSSENFATLKTATSGYYVLVEDINLEGETWAVAKTITFTGTLEGAGHIISNFQSTDTTNFSGLFYNLSGATIKNLAIVNHDSTMTQYGILAAKGSGNVTIKDVFIQSNYVPSSTVNTAFCGLFREHSASKVSLVNVVMSIPTTTSKVFGFIAGFGGNTSGGLVDALLTNCHFIGGANQLGGDRTGRGYGGVKASSDSTYTYYENAAAFSSATVTLPSWVQAWATEYVK